MGAKAGSPIGKVVRSGGANGQVAIWSQRPRSSYFPRRGWWPPQQWVAGQPGASRHGGCPRAKRCHLSNPGETVAPLVTRGDPQKRGLEQPVARPKGNGAARRWGHLSHTRFIASQGFLHTLVATHVQSHGLNGKNKNVHSRGATGRRQQGVLNGVMGQGSRRMNGIIQHQPVWKTLSPSGQKPIMHYTEGIYHGGVWPHGKLRLGYVPVTTRKLCRAEISFHKTNNLLRGLSFPTMPCRPFLGNRVKSP